MLSWLALRKGPRSTGTFGTPRIMVSVQRARGLAGHPGRSWLPTSLPPPEVQHDNVYQRDNGCGVTGHVLSPKHSSVCPSILDNTLLPCSPVLLDNKMDHRPGHQKSLPAREVRPGLTTRHYSTPWRERHWELHHWWVCCPSSPSPSASEGVSPRFLHAMPVTLPKTLLPHLRTWDLQWQHHHSGNLSSIADPLHSHPKSQ